MADAPDETPQSLLATLAAFSVHIFTACGAALALISLVAATDRNWPLMFGLLGLALIVDGIDGTFARYLRVAERLPRWSGDTLDLVVDFVTYVFLPAYAVAAGGLLPPLLALPAAIVIVLTGAIYFADRQMKLPGNYFRGFPALWNLAAFYLFLLRPQPWIAAAAVAVLAVATFLPFPFVHPFRVGRWRVPTIALVVIWSALALMAVLRGMMPGPFITAALCAIGLYFLGVGLLRRVE
jgi:phosphatidylcholine synthase